jgi:serine/threonine-protein kinase
MSDVLGPEERILGGRFRVRGVIGRGGMSIVYEAEHIQLKQRVAVKVLRTERDAISAFERVLQEARAAARLTSEHVVRVLDVDVMPSGHPYVVMERLTGRDLAKELQARGRLPPVEAVGLCLQVCEALAEAHAADLVHLDLKPSNVFLTKKPDGMPCAKLLDFGLVHTASRRSDAKQKAVGSPGYASPEQLGTKDDVDARADVWGMGVVLYELVSGRRPFEASSLSEGLIEVLSRRPAELVESVPRGLSDVIVKCLGVERETRYGSVVALADALAELAAPEFVAYRRRVRELSTPKRGSMSTLPPFPAADPASPRDGSAGSSPAGTEPHTTEGSSRDRSPLVVARLESPKRSWLWPVVVAAALVGAAVVGVAMRDRSKGGFTGARAPSGQTPSTTAPIGLLPPLPSGPQAPASATDQASAPPPAPRAATLPPVKPVPAPIPIASSRSAVRPAPAPKPPSGADPMTYR